MRGRDRNVYEVIHQTEEVFRLRTGRRNREGQRREDKGDIS